MGRGNWLEWRPGSELLANCEWRRGVFSSCFDTMRLRDFLVSRNRFFAIPATDACGVLN